MGSVTEGIDSMNKELMVTRREALQGMVGVAAAVMLPADSSAEKDATPWPADGVTNLQRMQPFNDNWRFHRGDAPGADAESFDDSNWRTLDVPHDWSIEDLPPAPEQGQGAIWDAGSTPSHAGPFDLYASEGQISTGWTVGGMGWYRKTFDKPQLPPGGKVELR